MLPEVVSDNWGFFAPLIEKSLPPVITNRSTRMANVLKSILTEELVVWSYYDKHENLKYVTTTQVREDPIVLAKDLLIYTFSSLGAVNTTEAYNGFEVLKKFARSRDCGSMIAYVIDPRIVQFLTSQGINMKSKVMQIEL